MKVSQPRREVERKKSDDESDDDESESGDSGDDSSDDSDEPHENFGNGIPKAKLAAQASAVKKKKSGSLRSMFS